jgi:hypothetical protein
MDLDVVVGLKGPIAPPEMCNGLMIPIVVFDQIYSFDRDSLIKSIPRPKEIAVKEFGAAAEEVFDRIRQMTDNAGATDEHRALNYLVVRYHTIYAKAAEEFANNASLTAVDVQPSTLSATRKVLHVIFSYTNRSTDVVDKLFVRVDVTDDGRAGHGSGPPDPRAGQEQRASASRCSGGDAGGAAAAASPVTQLLDFFAPAETKERKRA